MREKKREAHQQQEIRLSSIGSYGLMVVGVLLLLLAISGCKSKVEDPTSEVTVTTDKVAPAEDDGNTFLGETVDDEKQEVTVTSIIREGDPLGSFRNLLAQEEVVETFWDFPDWIQGEAISQGQSLYISPFGEVSVYDSFEYDDVDTKAFTYFNDMLKPVDRKVYGSSWEMIYPVPDGIEKADEDKIYKDFINKAVDQGAHMTANMAYGALAVFRNEEDKDVWVILEDGNYTIKVTVFEEFQLRPGESMSVEAKAFMDGDLFFSSTLSDDKFYTLIVQIEDGDFSLSMDKRDSYDAYRRSYSESLIMDQVKGTTYYFDNLPTDGGVLYYEVNTRGQGTGTIHFSLVETAESTKIPMDDALGAIVFEAKYVDRVLLEPVNDVYVSHETFDMDSNYMDKTAEGDYIITVPAGDWKATVIPKGITSVSNYATTLIPVYPNKITKVTIPLSMEMALDKELSSFALTSGIHIDRTKDGLDQISFDFTLADLETKSIEPDLSNTKIMEGGKSVEIISIENVKTPPSVVLVLDSSGSMKGQMDQTLLAAKTFIEGLPDDTDIQLLDFDTTPKLLEGHTKSQAVENLSKVSVGGATALYDSIVEATKLLEDLERPTIVAFSDGADENYNGSAPGSKLNIDEAIKEVLDSGISVFTIGFGPNHDSATLKRIAEESLGQYFAAEDQTALGVVFEAIKNKLNSTYTATYKRPTQSNIGDIPVVTLVLDVSGSMDMAPDEVCGYRMDNVKSLFHDFIMSLPDQTQMQLMTFNNDVMLNQGMTTDKTRMLSALGSLEAGGGTNILGSVEAGFKTLEVIPSSQKVMIYLTDAALDINGDDKDRYDKLLSDIKDAQINVLWVGLGETPNPEDFQQAARATGGDYVISEEASVLKAATDKLMNKVTTAEATIKTSIAISVVKKDIMGKLTPYSTSTLATLSPLPFSDDVIVSEAINYEVIGDLEQYDQTSSTYLSGDQVPNEAINIQKRFEVAEKGSNDAMTLEVQEVLFLKQLDGVSAPRGQRYVALLVEASNTMPIQEVVVYPDGSGHPSSWLSDGGAEGVVKEAKTPYMIPDIFAHFALRFNDKATHGLSPATWLANEPFSVPGISSVVIEADEKVSGALIFMVPDEAMTQLSLHYYDTNYGHIDLPIVGEMTLPDTAIDALPTQLVGAMKDGFKVTVTGMEDVLSISEEVVASDHSQFRVFEGNFTTQVQARLNLDPLERFFLQLPTASGDFWLPLSGATTLVPYGMATNRMVAPGASNLARWVFEVPDGLINNEMNIMVELKDEDLIVPAIKGTQLSGESQVTDHHEYADISINALVYEKVKIGGYLDNYVIADVTITDVKDGYATRGISPTLVLVEDGYSVDEAQAEDPHIINSATTASLGNFSSGGYSDSHILYPDSVTDELLLGLGEDSVIYDGTSRRGYIIYELNSDDVDKTYHLMSSTYENLKVTVTPGFIAEENLAVSCKLPNNHNFEEDLLEAIDEAVSRYQLENPKKVSDGENQGLQTDLSDSTEDKVTVPMPKISSYGDFVLNDIDSLEDLQYEIQNLRILHKDYGSNPFDVDHSAQSVLTQGWGTIPDTINLAIKGLSKLGYVTTLEKVTVTDQGRTIMEEYMNLLEGTFDMTYLPAVSFLNSNGEEEVWVLPFAIPIKEAKGLGYMAEYEEEALRYEYESLTVEYLVQDTNRDRNDALNDMNSALGGGSSSTNAPYWVEVLDQRVTNEQLSLDCIDIGSFINGTQMTAYTDGVLGKYIGDQYVDVQEQKVLEIKVTVTGYENRSYHKILTDQLSPDQIFITLGHNLPIPETQGGSYLEELSRSIYESALKPDEMSSLKWRGHGLIAEFLYQQGIFENEMAEIYDMTIGHVNEDITLVVVQTLDNDGVYQCHMDLLNHQQEIQMDQDSQDSDWDKKVASFHIMSGIHASILEEKLLGDKGDGVLGIWAKRPDTAELLILEPYSEAVTLEELMGNGYPEALAQYLVECRNYVIIPEEPSILEDGQPHFGWLEIDKDYRTIGMLDSYEHGAMSSETIIQAEVDAAYFLVGAFTGIDASIWSVSAFSLQLSDYAAIKEAAQAFALGLADNFEVSNGPLSMGVGGTPELSQSLGPIKGSLDSGGGSLSEDILGFKNGYESGVNYYFSKMP